MCPCAGKGINLGRNFLMSDALRLCWMVASCSACLINEVFVLIHCFIEALDFVSHSLMSILYKEFLFMGVQSLDSS